MEVVGISALVCVGIGAAIDVRTRRIPNWLTFGGAGVALAGHWFLGGTQGLIQSAEGWLVGVALFFPMFLLRGMGAGDVKLLGAVGAFLGPMGAVWAALFSVLAGGVLAIVVGAWHGYLGKAMKNLWTLIGFWRLAGVRPLPGLTVQDAAGPRLAYGVAIAAGTLTAVLTH